MPVPVTIPRLGWNMDEGTFVEWMKGDGESVRPGDVLFRLEGEKATEEIESLDSGTLHILASGPKHGDRLAVGSVIGYLLQPGEDAPTAPERMAGVRSPSTEIEPVRPDRRRLDHDSDLTQTARPAITPRALRQATRLGIDVSSMRGTGREGRIRERDVAAAESSGARAVKLTPIRRTIAARMIESRHATAPVTLLSEVDATRIVALRRRLRMGGGPVPSFTDFFVKLAGAMLLEHPLLASRWTDAGIVAAEQIDIGIAVDADAGLLVPVLRNVPALGLLELAARSRDLIERARQGTLSAEEMRGGCFTVTNLGAYGVDAFTPIINIPECAVLGIGRIKRQPVIEDDRVVGRDRVCLSLTFDHRIVDGGPAARFLHAMARSVENPDELVTP